MESDVKREGQNEGEIEKEGERYEEREGTERERKYMKDIVRSVLKSLQDNSTSDLYKMFCCFQGHIQGCLKH